MIDEKKLIEDIVLGMENCNLVQADVLKQVMVLINKQPQISKWIPCSERLPSKEECGRFGKDFNVTFSEDGIKVTTMKFVYETVRGREVGRWKWLGRMPSWKVTAWQQLPEPYREDDANE